MKLTTTGRHFQPFLDLNIGELRFDKNENSFLPVCVFSRHQVRARQIHSARKAISCTPRNKQMCKYKHDCEICNDLKFVSKHHTWHDDGGQIDGSPSSGYGGCGPRGTVVWSCDPLFLWFDYDWCRNRGLPNIYKLFPLISPGSGTGTFPPLWLAGASSPNTFRKHTEAAAATGADR